MKKLFLLGAISALVTFAGSEGTAQAGHRSSGFSYGYYSPSFSIYYGRGRGYYDPWCNSYGNNYGGRWGNRGYWGRDYGHRHFGRRGHDHHRHGRRGHRHH